MNKKIYFLLLLPLGVLISYISSLQPALVEAIYSSKIYITFSQYLSRITGLLPFSLGELIVVCLALYSIFALVCVFRQPKNKDRYFLLKIFLFRGLIAINIIYFVFILSWAINYHRLPFAELAGLKTQPASIHELESLCRDLINRTNTLRLKVNENEENIMEIANGKQSVFTRAHLGFENIAQEYPELAGIYGKPKGIRLSHLMSYTGIAGVYFPFTAEANVNRKIPDAVFPATTCHEMAHQRGFAREDEANYIAYLACNAHPDIDFKYSGNLLALIYSMRALKNNDLEKYNMLLETYNEGLSKDLKNMSLFWANYEGPIDRLSTKINNFYLKSNMQEDGIYSYGRMVDLLIAQHKTKRD